MTTDDEKRSFINKLIAYESGEMQNPADIIDFFQEMIDDGIIWELQGSYGRLARELIEQGYCIALKGE